MEMDAPTRNHSYHYDALDNGFPNYFQPTLLAMTGRMSSN